MDGDFHRGDVIAVRDPAGVEIARGLAEEILRDAPQVADAITARWFGGRAALLKA